MTYAQTIIVALLGAAGAAVGALFSPLVSALAKHFLEARGETRKARLGVESKRLSWYHDKQAEVLAGLYERLAVALEAILRIYVRHPEHRRDDLPELVERREKWLPDSLAAEADYRSFYYRHLIYVPDPLQADAQDFLKCLWNVNATFGMISDVDRAEVDTTAFAHHRQATTRAN